MEEGTVRSSKWDLITPALLVDLDALEFNIRHLAGYMSRHGKNWRPHAKAHKTPAIAHKQIEAGAIGITCAKLGEAEVMAASGIKHILVGNQVADRRRLVSLAHLQRETQVIVAVDNLKNVQDISQVAIAEGVRVPVVIEVDCGLDRAGLEPGQPVLDLAREIATLPGVSFKGLFTWEGFVLREKSLEKRMQLVHAALKKVVDTRSMLEEAGIRVAIVSAGGTGDYIIAAKHPGVTEIEAGGGCLMDLTYSDLFGHVGPLKYALTVLSTVVSRPAASRAVCDAGRKAMSDQRMMPRVRNKPGVKLARLSAEHGVLALESEQVGLEIGDKVEFIPGYSDDTVYLYDYIHAVRNDTVEAVWPILARGRKD